MTDTLDNIEPNINFREVTCDVPSNLDHELIRKIAKQWRSKPPIKTAELPKYLGIKEAEAVAIGARELDKVKPNWFRKVKPWKILLKSMRWCILGQAYGRFDVGIHFCLVDPINNIDPFIGDGFIETHFLKKAWRREIRARR